MGGKIVIVRAEAAQVDHLADAGRRRCLREHQSTLAIAFDEIRAIKGMDQVVGGILAIERARQFSWEETVRRTLDVYREALA